MRHLQAARGTALIRRASSASAARFTALGIAVFGLAVDQLTKLAALANLEWGEPVEVIGPLVRFTLISNPGAAFGMGSGSTLLLSLFAIAALLGCLTLGLSRIRLQSHAVALGLLIAGISGNLYDRLLRDPAPLYGHVIDFVQLPYFAIFNVADVCITSAAALIILLSLRHPADPAEDSGAETDAGAVEAKDG